VAEPIAKTPAQGLLPVTAGGVTLAEIDPGRITSIMPFKGRDEAVSAALMAAHGLAFPAPGRAEATAGARLQWTGRNQAFLIGPVPGDIPGAALTDQSDAWAVLRLAGARGPEVLARLCPIDLRPAAFPEGHAARSLIGHMTAALARTGPETLDLMVFRSMARTAVHEVSVAMKSVAAQSEAS